MSMMYSLVAYRSDPSSRMIMNTRPLTPIDKTRVSPSGKAPMKPHPSSVSNAGAQSTGHMSSTQKSFQPTSSSGLFGAELGTAGRNVTVASNCLILCEANLHSSFVLCGKVVFVSMFVS